MKNILLYAGLTMLVLASLLVGFVGGTDLTILCLSCLVSGSLLMAAWCFACKEHWDLFFLYLCVVCFHLFYLYAGTVYGLWLFLGAVISMIVSLVLLWLSYRLSFSLKPTLWVSLFVKAALIPELLLNVLLSKEGGESFITFSWILLFYTSIFVWISLWHMVKDKQISSSWAIAAALVECFFGTDILGTAGLLIAAYRYKKPEEVSKPKVYEKGAFQKGKRRKKIR